MAQHRNAEDSRRRVRVQERLSHRRYRAAPTRLADAQPGDGGIPYADHAGERDRVARRHAGIRLRKASAGRDLGRPGGCQDAPADRKCRDRLCRDPSQSSKRGAYGGRGAAQDARVPDGRSAALPRGHRTDGQGSGQGREIPGPAARLHGRCARRVFRRTVPDVFGESVVARFPGQRQDRPGRHSDEAAQSLSARQSFRAASNGVHERVRTGD